MVEEGAKIEGYFRDAVTHSASKHLQKEIETTMTVEYVISDTADTNNDFIVKKFCEQEDYRIYRNKPADVGTYDVEKLMPVIDSETGKVKLDKNGEEVRRKVKAKEYIKPKANHIDLIFNVGTIIMGYHVPYTSGVMMLRVTGTNIMFYQQLGRCFSAKASKQPIVLDVVSNTNKDYSCDEIKKVLWGRNNGDGSDNLREFVENIANEQVAVQVGYDENATQRFLNTLNAMKNPTYFEDEKILYLYEEREMPIIYIANDLQISCKRVVSVLRAHGIPLVDETNEYKRINKKLKEAEKNNINTDSILAFKTRVSKFLNSKSASKFYSEVKKDKSSKTLYKLLVKAGLGGTLK